MASDTTRLATLDGLRGWAALSVVVYHMTWETFGVVYPAFRSAPVSFVGDGSLAVAIFFTLSGYVLTLRRWHRTDNPNLLLVLLRRYFRLGIPIMAAVLLAWALMATHLNLSVAAAPIVQREDWLGSFANFKPNLIEAMWFGLVNVYWIQHGHSYGPFLWTMMIELLGSFVVLSLTHTPRLFREAYSPLLLALVLMLRFFPLAACFAAGAMIALAERDGLIFKGPPGRTESAIATAALAAALVAACIFQLVFASLLPAACAGTVVFVAAARSGPAQAFLSLPISRFLGHISFPLYLVQYLVIISAMSWLIIALNDAHLLTPWSAIAVAVVSTLACVAVAWAFLPVETFTLRIIKRIGRPRRSKA